MTSEVGRSSYLAGWQSYGRQSDSGAVDSAGGRRWDFGVKSFSIWRPSFLFAVVGNLPSWAVAYWGINDALFSLLDRPKRLSRTRTSALAIIIGSVLIGMSIIIAAAIYG